MRGGFALEIPLGYDDLGVAFDYLGVGEETGLFRQIFGEAGLPIGIIYVSICGPLFGLHAQVKRNCGYFAFHMLIDINFYCNKYN